MHCVDLTWIKVVVMIQYNRSITHLQAVILNHAVDSEIIFKPVWINATLTWDASVQLLSSLDQI